MAQAVQRKRNRKRLTLASLGNASRIQPKTCAIPRAILPHPPMHATRPFSAVMFWDAGYGTACRGIPLLRSVRF
jgi:hypothetical protein